MKKLLSLLVVFICLVSCSVMVFGAEGPNPDIYIQQANGKFKAMTLEYGGTFIDSNGRTQVPLRAFAESIRGNGDGDNPEYAVAYGTSGPNYKFVDVFSHVHNKFYKFVIGDKNIYNADGTIYRTMDTEARIINDRTFIPIRYAAESLGFTVKWDEKNQVVRCYRK